MFEKNKMLKNMNKILIATMHKGHNYGSALQAYALSEVIKSLGHDPLVLDYIPQRVQSKRQIVKLLSIIFGFKSSINSRYNAVRGLMIHISDEYFYNKFFANNIDLTKRFNSFEEVIEDCPKADIYLTGSDQVWNSIHNQGIDRVFYLDFLKPSAIRLAYASSFGQISIKEDEKTQIQSLLSSYKAISVRELSAVSLLESMGINNCPCVLDPTLLLSKKEWVDRCPKLNIQDKFVLIYSVEPNKKELIAYASKIADRLGLKIYIVSWGFKKYQGVDKMIYNVTPDELMSHFIQADFIVTSSFHGTAFSINLNKQFISVLPQVFATRQRSLLELAGLEDRMVVDDFDVNKSVEFVDYSLVNLCIEKQREQSLSFLVQNIDRYGSDL